MRTTFRGRFSSLRVQILTIVLIAWLAPALALSWSIASIYFPALSEKTEMALVAGAQNAHSAVLGDVERLIKLAKDVTYDGEISSAYSYYSAGKYRYQKFYLLCKNYLERRFSRNERINYAAFFPIDAPGQFIFTSAGYPAAMFFQPTMTPSLIAMSEALDTRCRFLYRDGELYLVRNLLNSRLDRFGMLVLSINQDALFLSLTEGGASWGATIDIVLDEYKTSAASGMEDMPMGLSQTPQDVLYRMGSKTRDYDLQVLVRQSKSTLYAGMEGIRRTLLVLLAALVPVCVLVMLYLNRRVIVPIRMLSSAAGRMEKGELGVTVPMQGPDELGRLGSAFSGMSVKLARLVDTVYKEEIALRDAQLQAMQSRINPHFMNNALELINWQARMDGDGAICSMVDALSILMNAALDRSDRRLVPLKEEMEVAQAYLYFLQQRFGERLHIECTLDEALDAHLVPRLAIQMLMENAAEHGISPAGGGRLAFCARREGDMLVVEVRNGGKPLAPHDRDRIDAILSGRSVEGACVGLRNVNERLRLIYMGKARLTVDAAAGGETVARMEIPIS